MEEGPTSWSNSCSSFSWNLAGARHETTLLGLGLGFRGLGFRVQGLGHGLPTPKSTNPKPRIPHTLNPVNTPRRFVSTDPGNPSRLWRAAKLKPAESDSSGPLNPKPTALVFRAKLFQVFGDFFRTAKLLRTCYSNSSGIMAIATCSDPAKPSKTTSPNARSQTPQR